MINASYKRKTLLGLGSRGIRIYQEGRKEGMKEGRKEERKEGRKEGSKEERKKESIKGR